MLAERTPQPCYHCGALIRFARKCYRAKHGYLPVPATLVAAGRVDICVVHDIHRCRPRFPTRR